jgi:hypothetical protein
MSASGAIATAATHGARHSECVADRQTWQVACQVAVRKGLLSAAQQRRRRRPFNLFNLSTLSTFQPFYSKLPFYFTPPSRCLSLRQRRKQALVLVSALVGG